MAATTEEAEKYSTTPSFIHLPHLYLLSLAAVVDLVEDKITPASWTEQESHYSLPTEAQASALVFFRACCFWIIK